MSTTWRILLTFLATVLGLFIGATAGLILAFVVAWILCFIPGLEDGYVLVVVFWLITCLMSIASAMTCGVHVYRSTRPKVQQLSRGFEVLQKK